MILSIKDDDESGDTDISLKSFVDTSGEKAITILTAGEQPKSPLTGKNLEPYVFDDGEDMQVASTLDDILSNHPTVGTCEECNHDLVMSAELATALDDKEIACLNCGESVAVAYFGDLLEESMDMDDEGEGNQESDEEDEDDSDLQDDDMDDEDDSDEGSDDDEDGDSEDEDDSDSDDEDDSDGDDSNLDLSNMGDEDANSDSDDSDDSGKSEEEGEQTSEETPDDSSSDDETTDSEPEPDEGNDSTEETPTEVNDSAEPSDTAEPSGVEDSEPAETVESTIEITGMSVANLDEDLRMVGVNAELSRIEVFKGNTHIGYILKEEASETVQPLFAKTVALRKAFAFALSSATEELVNNEEGEKTEDLKDFGFTATKTSVDIESDIDDLATKSEAEIEAEVEEKVEAHIEAFNKTFTTALVGVNKGVLDGPNFQSEIASTMKRHGVKNSHAVARRLMERASQPFLKSVLESAKHMQDEGPDYTRAIASTVEAASFLQSDESVEDEEISANTVTAAAFGVSTPKTKTQPETSKVETAAESVKPKDGYQSIFKRF